MTKQTPKKVRINPKAGDTIMGITDKNGRHFKVGDYVREDLDFGKAGNLPIYGQIVYGYYSAGYDEWGMHFKTIGFFIKFSDGSGTTGLDSGWYTVSKHEYEEATKDEIKHGEE